MNKNKNEAEQSTLDIHMNSSNYDLLIQYHRLQQKEDQFDISGSIRDLTRLELLLGVITKEQAKTILVNELQRLATLGYEEYFMELVYWQGINREFSLGLDELIIETFGRELSENEKNIDIYSHGVIVFADDFRFKDAEEHLLRGSEVIRGKLENLIQEYKKDNAYIIDHSEIYIELINNLSFINRKFRNNKAQFIEIQKNNDMFIQLIDTVGIKNLPIDVLDSCLRYGYDINSKLQTQLIKEASRRIKGLQQLDYDQDRIKDSLIGVLLKAEKHDIAIKIFETFTYNERHMGQDFAYLLDYALEENNQKMIEYVNNFTKDDILFWWGLKAIKLSKQSYHFDNPNVIQAIKEGCVDIFIKGLIKTLSMYPEQDDLRLLIEERIKHLLKTDIDLGSTIIDLAYLRSIKPTK